MKNFIFINYMKFFLSSSLFFESNSIPKKEKKKKEAIPLFLYPQREKSGIAKMLEDERHFANNGKDILDKIWIEFFTFFQFLWIEMLLIRMNIFVMIFIFCIVKKYVIHYLIFVAYLVYVNTREEQSLF